MIFLEKYNEGQTLLIDKDLEWTSFDVVKKIKFLIKCKKVGHAGTLDPLATGLLLICTGKKTKIIETLQNLDKTYYATFYIGKTTPSFDRETEYDYIYPIDHINQNLIIEALNDFQGEIKQKPPIYSALKIKGKRLYEIARKGGLAEINNRSIKIFEFKLLNNNLPELDFKIKCSKGTYIRSLAHDYGKKLNSGAHLKYLERYSIGEYNINESYSLGEINKLLFD